VEVVSEFRALWNAVYQKIVSAYSKCGI